MQGGTCKMPPGVAKPAHVSMRSASGAWRGRFGSRGPGDGGRQRVPSRPRGCARAGRRPPPARPCAADEHARHYSPRTERAYVGWIRRFIIGHSDVSTTMIYTDILNSGGRGVRSPLDRAR